MSRVCEFARETLETYVEVKLDIDTKGEVTVETPVPFLNHMLANNVQVHELQGKDKSCRQDALR